MSLASTFTCGQIAGQSSDISEVLTQVLKSLELDKRQLGLLRTFLDGYELAILMKDV